MLPSLLVERMRLCERVRIDRNDRVQRRALAVERIDALQVVLHQRLGRKLAGGHLGL
jgi:hypothetical protein